MGETKTLLPNNIRKPVKSILIAIPLTRKWAVQLQIEQLIMLNKFTDIDTHILFFIDNKDLTIDYVENQCKDLEIPYSIYNTGNKPPHEIRLNHRRDRIRDMLTLLQEHIKGMIKEFDLLFMVEDDTNIQSDALERLMLAYRELTANNVNVGFIEGVQVGRHGIRMIGAWRCNDLEEPSRMETIPYNQQAVYEKIDGGGLYCFITPMKLFLGHRFFWDGECFGPDVTFGLELRKKGFVNIIDWTVQTGHVDRHGNCLLPDENVKQAKYLKVDNVWKLQP